MITLCHVLHLRTSELVPVNDISKLKKFAAVADKYDCKHASMFFGRVWLERIECKTEDLIDLLILAHNFDDHQTFVRASKLMVDALSVRRIVQDFQKADSRLPSIIYGKFQGHRVVMANNAEELADILPRQDPRKTHGIGNRPIPISARTAHRYRQWRLGMGFKRDKRRRYGSREYPWA